MPAPSYKTNRTSLITNVPSKFELIHMDTVTIDKPSMYKNKCILTILDEYTRYGWVLFTNSKEKIFNIFFNWYKKIKNIFNKNIKYIRTDNRTEFNNLYFERTSVLTKAL